MKRHICPLCDALVADGEDHSCLLSYIKDDADPAAIYEILQRLEAPDIDVNNDETKGYEASSPNDVSGSECETTHKTGKASHASPAHCILYLKNKEKYEEFLDFAKDFENRPILPDALERLEKNESETKSSFELTDASALAGPSGSSPHSSSQAMEKQHVCNLCPKQFRTKFGLAHHQFTHSGGYPYKCETCKKGFSHKGYLKRHARTHSGEKPYKCDTCKKGFFQKGCLKRHARTHSGEKPHVCKTCKKGFSQKCNLISHFSTHSSEKPYKCDTCKIGFSQKRCLKRHARIHSGEKPYKCDTCEKAFTRKDGLDKHQILHKRDKSSLCDT